ncbi:hypothetical protein COCON_G00162840 [Conger conger]|uniref:Insulin-like domain-containing protein n=1 Tax=Conger conger TaxID=82655 RepID=A0A9Q1D6C4_CONCO|nr:hypothetical protein COCON_G00162840 [Conger conger]
MYRFLSMVIVFVSIVGICTGSEDESKAVLMRDYGVKLCGREFIRAVIFTCGGSRWKRSGQVDSLQSRNSFRDRQSWLQSALAAMEHPQKLGASLADLLKELGDSNDYETGAEPRQNEKPGWESKWKQGPAMTLGNNPTIPWPRPNRQKRNFSLGLAGMCCNQGCTKNDIGRLC